MLQTFKDHDADSVERREQTAARFWFDVVGDEARGVIREQFAVLREAFADYTLYGIVSMYPSLWGRERKEYADAS
jgi:hypothetical protein